MNGKATLYCPDCGPATVPHWVERAGARADAAAGFLGMPFELVWRGVKPLFEKLRLERLLPRAAEALAAVGLGTIVAAPDGKANWRTRVLWEEAERRGIAMREFRPLGLARETFFASYGGDTVAFDGLPLPRGAHRASLSWMDNKGTIIKKFRAAGIPVPEGASCTRVAQAEAFFGRMQGPAVVKPSIGSRSRHTYIHVADLASLRRAFAKAKELSPHVVVEEEIPGFVFRITLVNYKVAGIMRREPPHVTGDGEHTVRELAEKENEDPMRRGPIFHELVLDGEAEKALAVQGMTLASVPPRGAMVLLHEKVSRAFGASTTEMEDIHPDNRALFVKIARVLRDPLVGVDFIASDLGRSWREQKCGVIECNSLPFIDLHHYPLKGRAGNVAGDVWEMVFPGSAE